VSLLKFSKYKKIWPVMALACGSLHTVVTFVPSGWHIGGFLVRILVLVGAPRGRTGPFFRLPGRGGHLAPGQTGHQVVWSGEARGSRGGAPGGAALAFAPGRAAGAVFFQGGALGDKWLDRTGAACQSWARKN
jgi:hypothetical protein